MLSGCINKMAFIRRDALEFMLGVSREAHPREFIGLLRGDENTVREVMVIPASLYGEGFSHFNWMHVGMDKSIIGSVHSHPSTNNRPSKTDVRNFSKTGDIHLIIKYPYETAADVACYDSRGNRQDIIALE
ncbi:MAG: hypothetical protein GF416_03575 [Candidatus Altiarchaeales archaeon]|nr:hypothetical protein [Candidatus Altiarchaeales archaeon]MBD3416199.1 hypothetical protein [Candidatus Altiarchaeales archaeon]